MLSFLILVAIFLKEMSCEAPIHSGYLPPVETPVFGYPPSKPHPSPIIPIENEDPESIVIEAPSFGRNVNILSGGADTESRLHSSELDSRPHSASAAHRNPNTDPSFTHFHSGTTASSYSIDGGDGTSNNNIVYRPDQNYARTGQHKPTVHDTLSSSSTSFNYSRRYQETTGSTPYQIFNTDNLLQHNLPKTKAPHTPPSYVSAYDSYLHSPINSYQTLSSYYPIYIKDQYHNQNNNAHSNSNHDYPSNPSNRINNQYLPPSIPVQQQTGYNYEQPSIPFNYDNNVNKNGYTLTGTQSSGGKNLYQNNCQTSFK